MKFMISVKSAETFGPPPKELMDAIASLGMEATQKGVLVDTGGLMPTSEGARIRLADGKLTTTDGPFTEAKEVVGGFAIYELPSKTEAITWTCRFMEAHLENWPGWEGVAEIRPMFTPFER
jgi:hypothetical protein